MKLTASRAGLFAVILLSLLSPLRAQDANSAEQENANVRSSPRASRAAEEPKGFYEYETFQGVIGPADSILKLESTLGYDFNRYAGILVGVPLYLAHESASGSSPVFTANGMGDVHFGVELYVPMRLFNYGTTLTVSAPTGNVGKGFSTGHPTVDWTNRFRRRFRRLTPFVIAGISNSVPDTDLVTRTFTSFGNVVHFEEGAEYELTSRLYAGGSAYHVLPFGNQRVFNRLTEDTGGNNAGPDQESRSHVQPSATGSNLTREDGFDAWLGFEPTRMLRMEAGYSRSLTFALNRLSFNVGLNVGRMLRTLKLH